MSGEVVDAAALTSRFVLALVFLAAAVPKLFAPEDFRRAVANYALLPSRFVRPVATWLPWLELFCAAALLVGVGVTPVSVAVAALLGAFALAIAANLLRGRTIDCGCYGSVAPRQIGWGVVAGDLLLAMMAILAAAVNPDVLALDVAFSAGSSSLTAQEGIAFLLVASTLVLSHLLVSSWLSLRSATREEGSV